jgi:hypothetical protein
MALQKTFQAPNGATVQYWKVNNVALNYQVNTATIQLAGYLDQNNRQQNFMPTMRKNFTLIEGEFENYFTYELLNAAGNNPVKAAYVFIKTQPEFIDATDVLESEFAPEVT